MSQPNAKKGRGCLFYGCLTVILVMLMAVVGIYFGIRSMANSFVQQYTETQPMEFPEIEINDSELESLQARVASFMEAVEGGESTEPLRLDTRELNALIAHHEDFKAIKDNVRVDIVEDRILGQISIPAELIPVLGLFANLEGRYLNGKSEFSLSMKQDELVVQLESLEVSGNKLPESVMTTLREENLAKDATKGSGNEQILDQIESIEVKDGEIIVTAKEKPVPSESNQSP